MFFSKKPKDPEIEIEYENKINDIFEDERLDIDLSYLYEFEISRVAKKLTNKNTQDIKNNLKEKIYLWFKKKIKLVKLKNPINDIKKVKKKKPIVLKDYNPKNWLASINLLDIENFKTSKWPYPDIYKINYPFYKKIEFFLKRKFSNFKFNNLKILTFFIVFLVLLFSSSFLYKSYIENKLNSITLSLKNFEFTWDINENISKIEDLKFDIVTLKFASKPLFVLNIFLWIDQINNLENILNAWTNLSDAALDSLFIYTSFEENIKTKWIENFYFWEFMKNSQEKIMSSYMNLNKWIWELENINTNSLEDNIKNQFEIYLDKLKKAQNIYATFIDNFDTIKEILWDEEKKKYVIAFQNSDEIRPTGWFMWSMLFFDVFKWKLENYEKKDIYALEWNLKPFTEKAPAWLNKITDTFWLRDANYYPDIETSSLKIKEFLDKAWYEVDWIIYINQNIILDFLDYFGWVYFPQIDKTLTWDNFSMMTSALVESKAFKSWTLWTPKQVLFDFIIIFFDELKTKWDYKKYAEITLKWIKENEIIPYFFDEKENEFLKNIWFKNDLVDINYLDFNYPVFTSISWNKSDRYIKRSFEKNINIWNDCSIDTSLNIKTKHTFDIWEELSIKNFLYDMNVLWDIDINELLSVQWKWVNKQFVRVYIPKDAIIDNSDKYKIKVLDDRKEISFYQNTPLLFDSSFNINYTIPNTECKSYNYEFVKQPWIRWYDFIFNKNWNLEMQNYNTTNFIYK